MKQLLSLLLCLPLLASAQDATDSLTDQKWYPEYEIINGKQVPAPKAGIHGNHWIYFGKTFFFVDFRGPKKVKRGRWSWNASTRAFTINSGQGKKAERGIYKVRHLGANRLELELPDKKIIGMNNGRAKAS
ncbi:hypothetical protein [Flaviaesturariibacter amylovorans]|uniref:Uncharacterized protein n=1 Tax=Flaviaesturariibacter amylovorans TaxID=1084520 RepID=A0ABP8GN38_9BACT